MQIQRALPQGRFFKHIRDKPQVRASRLAIRTRAGLRTPLHLERLPFICRMRNMFIHWLAKIFAVQPTFFSTPALWPRSCHFSAHHLCSLSQRHFEAMAWKFNTSAQDDWGHPVTTSQGPRQTSANQVQSQAEPWGARQRA